MVPRCRASSKSTRQRQDIADVGRRLANAVPNPCPTQCCLACFSLPRHQLALFVCLFVCLSQRFGDEATPTRRALPSPRPTSASVQSLFFFAIRSWVRPCLVFFLYLVFFFSFRLLFRSFFVVVQFHSFILLLILLRGTIVTFTYFY